jgi:hypothetical protein
MSLGELSELSGVLSRDEISLLLAADCSPGSGVLGDLCRRVDAASAQASECAAALARFAAKLESGSSFLSNVPEHSPLALANRRTRAAIEAQRASHREPGAIDIKY